MASKKKKISRRRQRSARARPPRLHARPAISIRPSRLTTPGSCACRRCTSSTTRRAATPRASPWCSCMAAPAAAPIPKMRRFFNPKRYRIVLFDQRGSGKSRPQRESRRQHHLASRRRHRSAARASEDRPLAGVRRLVGFHARARVRAEASRALHRDRVARHLPAAALRARVVLSERSWRRGAVPRFLGAVPEAAVDGRAQGLHAVVLQAAHQRRTARRCWRPRVPGPSGRARSRT